MYRGVRGSIAYRRDSPVADDNPNSRATMTLDARPTYYVQYRSGETDTAQNELL